MSEVFFELFDLRRKIVAELDRIVHPFAKPVPNEIYDHETKRLGDELALVNKQLARS